MRGASTEEGVERYAPFLLPPVFIGPRDKREDDGINCCQLGGLHSPTQPAGNFALTTRPHR